MKYFRFADHFAIWKMIPNPISIKVQYKIAKYPLTGSTIVVMLHSFETLTSYTPNAPKWALVSHIICCLNIENQSINNTSTYIGNKYGSFVCYKWNFFQKLQKIWVTYLSLMNWDTYSMESSFRILKFHGWCVDISNTFSMSSNLFLFI